MNLLLLESHEIDYRSPTQGHAMLEDRRADHIRKVLGLKVGDTLRCGVVDDDRLAGSAHPNAHQGARGSGRVTAIDKRRVSLELELEADTADVHEASAMADVELILAMPRPPVLHRVLQHAATFGIARLHITNAWRVEKSFFQTPSLRPEAIRRQLILGAEQGRRTRLPEVIIEPLLVPFVRSLGDADRDSRLIAHPGAASWIEEAMADASAIRKRHLLAIGPEGGWIDRELETFGEHGFQSVSFGPWILRSEAAVNVALAQLAMARRLTGRNSGDTSRESSS